VSDYNFPPEPMTIGQKYTNLLASVQTSEQAKAYFEACVKHSMTIDIGLCREDAEAMERSNIGYVAGYFSQEEAARIHKLFGFGHPILGNAADWPKMSPESILEKGAAWASDGISDEKLVDMVNARAGRKVAELRDGYIYCADDADPGEDGQFLPY
jgi:hypothetical protein